MFVDNVVVILMMAPVALPLARALKLPVTPLVLMIGFAANFMGSAMLLGDLPPQMLHSVAGAEFIDFFWQHGRPPRTGRSAAGQRDAEGADAREGAGARVPVGVRRSARDRFPNSYGMLEWHDCAGGVCKNASSAPAPRALDGGAPPTLTNTE